MESKSTTLMSAVEFSPTDRVSLVKHVTNEHFWSIVSNPVWGFHERACSDVLDNEFVSYVEYENCNVLHRMIRFSDFAKYGMQENEIASALRLSERGE